MYIISNEYPEGISPGRLSSVLSIITKSRKEQGAIIAGIIAVILLGAVQALIIPGILQVATTFELFFVNNVGMHFESGTLIFAITLFFVIIAGLFITRRINRPGWNTAILAFTMLVIGYSTFLILVVRSNAHTPMDENHPSDPINLHAYLGRQQYGDWPLLYGQYYTAPLDTANSYVDGEPVYGADEKTGRYVVLNDMKKQVPNYDSRFCTFFPRMYDDGENHPDGYRNWGDTTMVRIPFVEKGGHKEIIPKPTYLDNMRYFARYQVNFMFWRYFMWNYCGRENDIQGDDSDDKLHGNWITGISFIDKLLGIPQENIPAEYAKNKGRNVMYSLPLLLGLLGFIYQYRKDKENLLVLTVFFFFTGLAIVLYLNQAPYQPRERDYSYVGAFYAFAIWIGLGVLAIADFMASKLFNGMHGKKSAAVATLVAMIVPIVMAHAEWDDHDRSARYTCRDMAVDFLQSCAPNAILFCEGDNETFPLWYAQEVEGIRTDVRVCNLSLLDGSWYVDQMKRRTYESAALPISLTHDQFVDGTRDLLMVAHTNDTTYELSKAIEFIKSEKLSDKVPLESGKYMNYLPSNYMRITIDKDQVMKNKVVTASLKDSLADYILWKIPGNYVEKNDMVLLDILAHDDWSRPIYFTTFSGQSAYFGLQKYFQQEGLTYRLVPIKNTERNTMFDARIATDVMYNNMVNKFKWGNMSSGVYLDETIRHMVSSLRQSAGILAQTLINEHKLDSAKRVLNICTDSIPDETDQYDSPMILIAYCYYQLGDVQRANKISVTMFDAAESKLRYFNTLDEDVRMYYDYEGIQSQSVLQKIFTLTQAFNQRDLATDFGTRLNAMMKEHIISPPQQQQ